MARARHSQQGDLFDARASASTVAAAELPAATTDLAARLPASLFLGTSSWAFPGWHGLVYGTHVPREVLARKGLAAYAQHPLLRAVGIDRSWYAPLTAANFAGYAEQVPPQFRFLVKADRRCTSPVLQDPRGARRSNPHCLDPAYATDAVVAPFAEGLGDHAGPLLFQFTPGGGRPMSGARRFADRLHDFLAGLPPGPGYAIEVRDDELLTDEYFQVLAETGARHCLSLHPRIGLTRQVQGLATLPPGPLIVRWNLHPAFHYEGAREAFAPFDALRRPDPERRMRVARLCLATLRAGETCFVFANNKAEGSAPLTLTALAETITGLRGAGEPHDPTVIPTA